MNWRWPRPKCLYNISYSDRLRKQIPARCAVPNYWIMYARQTVSAIAPWRYEELPPADLIKSLHLEGAAIDHDDLLRAEWFWDRRPRVLSGNLTVVFCYLALFVFLLCLIPDTIPLLGGLMLAGAVFSFIEGIRHDRWRNDYESSITRIVARLSERK